MISDEVQEMISGNRKKSSDSANRLRKIEKDVSEIKEMLANLKREITKMTIDKWMIEDEFSAI